MRRVAATVALAAVDTRDVDGLILSPLAELIDRARVHACIILLWALELHLLHPVTCLDEEARIRCLDLL